MRATTAKTWIALDSLQNTIGSAVVFDGIGTHSAAPTRMTIHPADADMGIVFARTDLPGGTQIIPALWDHVTDTRGCTKVSNDQGVSVSTIEHIMAALYACEIDNAYIEINGPEVPIMDGSSDVFMSALLQAGIAAIDAPRRTIEILKPILVRDREDSWVSISPAEQFTIDCEHHFGGRVDFPTQRFTGNMTPAIFREQVAAARTFGFVEDVEQLRAMGLARGSSLENAIGIHEGRVINPEGLRFENEFVLHKVLDMVGDLYTAGARIKGKIHGSRTGHSMMNQLLRALFSNPNNWRII